MSRQLADLLVKDRVITAQQLNEVIPQAGEGKSLVRLLIERKTVSETKLLYYLSQKFGLASVNLDKFEIPQEVLALVPTDLVRKHQAIPIQAKEGTLVVAVCDPSNMSFVEPIRFVAKMNVDAVLTSYSAFDNAYARYFGGTMLAGSAIENFQKERKKESRAEAAKNDAGNAIADSLEIVSIIDIDRDNQDQDLAPVITLVNSILSESIRRRASDIHLEPYEKRVRVRMRMDGSLIEVLQIPLEMKRAVAARLKILAKMDIGEQRVPQDGRIKLRMGGVEIDFRVSSMPTVYGEKIVLRLLNKSNTQMDFAKLGFDPDQLALFKKGIYAPNGMVLATGPTGSGKTTTLYTALNELNQISDNISTVEDPVEYNFEGINQVQVHSEIGLTFANVLRTLLRQDPDTILVGEIRDFETAEVSIQAALTGHLVLSTLHTNDAPSSIVRLMNMGVEPFLIVACLNTVIAQRLVRTICQKCRIESPVPQQRLIEVGFKPEVAARLQLTRGKGCPSCANSGYRGRVAIYEVMDFSNSLKEMVLRGESAMAIKRQAITEGMKTLRMSALARVAEGKTTIEEAIASSAEG